MAQPVNVLIIDDDTAARRLMTAALSTDCVNQVTAVATPLEALQYLKHNQYNVVICQLQLPEEHGLEVIRRMRTAVGVTPLLVLSTSHQSETLALVMQAGADDYLQKPIDLQILRRAVAALGEKKRTASDSNHAVPSISTCEEGTFVELTAFSEVGQVEKLQRVVERMLGNADLSKDDRHDLRLALEEIVRNALEWGNRFDPNKKLRLSYCLLDDRITFRIEDEGNGFDPAVLGDPSLDPKKHIETRKQSGKRMGGWGIFLTRKTMDEVSFNQKGNVVFLTKYLKRRQDSRTDNPALSATDLLA